jgi:hypothetical protein
MQTEFVENIFVDFVDNLNGEILVLVTVNRTGSLLTGTQGVMSDRQPTVDGCRATIDGRLILANAFHSGIYLISGTSRLYTSG